MAVSFSFPLKNKKIILASASKTRVQILKNAGIDLDLWPVECPEAEIKAHFLAKQTPLKEISVHLAQAKAEEAYKQLQKLSDKRLDSVFIIGADQILVCENKLYNKPKNRAEARYQLSSMRGKKQFLHTSFCLYTAGETVFTYTESPSLKMRNFSEEMLEAYLDFEGEELLFCVGACRIEGPGIQLFDSIEGAQETILGLPLLPLLQALRERKMIPS